MTLFGHRLFYAPVVHKSARQTKGHLVYCNKCGAYFWQRAHTLLEQCGARDGRAMRLQLNRIKTGLFPSGLQPYVHLELGSRTRLSGPHAALVQDQLEELAGTSFGGARAPLLRRRVKSPSIQLQEFPGTIPDVWSARQQVMNAHGFSEVLLKRMVTYIKEAQARRDAKFTLHSDEELHSDQEP